MLLEKSRETTPERMETEPKQKQHPVVDVVVDGSNINNLRYAGDTTLMAESEELKEPLDESERGE